jgi:hypothetical protein
MPKTSNPPTFDPKSYSKITLNDLVVYSTYYLHKQGSGITSEDIVSACFVLFPKRFSLKRYPHWPDSAVVSRRWSDCRGKGYLRGAVNGFKITARGIRHAEKIEKSLVRVRKPALSAPKLPAKKSVLPAQGIHPELKVRARKYIRSIETSDAYKHYRKSLPLNEFDFRSLLLCTMESPPARLAKNMEQFKEYVKIYDREDLLTFLEFSEDRFSHLLDASSSPARKK